MVLLIIIMQISTEAMYQHPKLKVITYKKRDIKEIDKIEHSQNIPNLPMEHNKH